MEAPESFQRSFDSQTASLSHHRGVTVDPQRRNSSISGEERSDIWEPEWSRVSNGSYVSVELMVR